MANVEKRHSHACTVNHIRQPDNRIRQIVSYKSVLRRCFMLGEAENCDVKFEHRRRKKLGGSGAWPRKMLKTRVSKIPFPAFFGKNLQNSEGYETPYKKLKSNN